jgi:release factor glutamine methyltransferase
MTRSVIARNEVTKQSNRRDCFGRKSGLATTYNIAFLKEIESQLRSAKVLSPRVEAERLMLHFGRMTRLDLFTDRKKLSSPARVAIWKALKIRKTGKPLCYVTGEAPFYGYDFKVNPDVLIPRPETEHLVEETLAILKANYKDKTCKILDIGTGSGCIAVSLTLQNPACRMTALDASPKALNVARKNIKLFGLNGKIRTVQSRLFGAFGKEKEAFWDVIVSNPPYVPAGELAGLSREVRSEPRLALDGGVQGLETLEAILEEAPRFLKKGGWLLMEIGRGQSKPLSKILKQGEVFGNFRFVKDLNGIDRVLIARHG